MTTETETNPVADDDLRVQEEEVETEDQADQGEADDLEPEEGQLDEGEAEEELEEVEWEGKTLKLPKGVKSGLMMQADYTRKTQEVAEERRALESQKAEINQLRESSEALLEQRANIAAAKAQLERYEKLDWDALQQQDFQGAQTEWMRYQRLQKAHDQAVDELKTKEGELAAETQRERAKRIEEGYAQLPKIIEGWSPKLEAEIADFAKSEGIAPQELAEAVAEPRNIKLLHLAMLGAKALKSQQAAQKAQKAAAVQPAAKVAGNGAPPTRLRDDISTDEWMRRRQKTLSR